MRNETELDNLVDVRTHAQKAADRVSTNGRLREAEPVTIPTWYKRLFRWETIIMPHKTVDKGFVVTPTIAAVLLAAFLGAVGWAYKSNTADQRETRDAIIEMKTMLNERTQTFKEQQAKIESDLATERRVAELQREKQRDEVRDMKAALQQSGIKVQ